MGWDAGMGRRAGSDVADARRMFTAVPSVDPPRAVVTVLQCRTPATANSRTDCSCGSATCTHRLPHWSWRARSPCSPTSTSAVPWATDWRLAVRRGPLSLLLLFLSVCDSLAVCVVCCSVSCPGEVMRLTLWQSSDSKLFGESAYEHATVCESLLLHYLPTWLASLCVSRSRDGWGSQCDLAAASTIPR